MENSIPKLEELQSKFDQFLALAEETVDTQPWLVVILMHEYFRNIFPADPYLPFDASLSHGQRAFSVLGKNIDFLRQSRFLGSYFDKTSKVGQITAEHLLSYGSKTKGETQQVYDRLWKRFDVSNYLKEAKEIIVTRFQRSGLDFRNITGRALDLGCGSGRFTIALSLLTSATKVYGVDLDEESIARGNEIAKRAEISNIEFQKADVLNIPFQDDFFDFVFCNGVLHHTLDMEKGIREMYRVLKPGMSAYLYLYGDGGLYWYSREKMSLLMKKIPQEYTMAILDIIGMPPNRFIFTDNWYVPKERHTTKDYLERYLKEVGFVHVRKFIGGRATDLDGAVASGSKEAEMMWGDGEHRYIMEKPKNQ